MTSELATSAVMDWLRRRSTPLCWLVGPRGSGKTETVRAVLATAGYARVLPLSAASPDRCLQQVFADRVTAGIFARLAADAGTPLVLDALDTAQYQDEDDEDRLGQVSDPRLRQLLNAAARGRWPELRVLVTSRLPPPRDLPADAVSVIELAARAFVPRKLPFQSGPVLEALASSRKASSGWLLGLLTAKSEAVPSLATPASVREVIDQAVSAGLVTRVEFGASGEWFQMSDAARRDLLPAARAAAVHAAIADTLEGEAPRGHVEFAAESDPELLHDLLERAMEHRLAAGDVPNAVLCYWQRLGNFSQLERENAIHLGARACHSLNGGRPPRRISPALKESPGALAVINDWGVHAISGGDVDLACEAALAAYELRTEALPLWDQSMLARHAGEAFLASGRVSEAVRWATLARRHALSGLRKSEGIPTREVMYEYDLAFYLILKIAAVVHDSVSAERILGEMEEVHSRARKVLSNANRSLTIPVPGPEGEVEVETLLDGRPAALVAMLAGRPAEALRTLESQLARSSREWLASSPGLDLRTLLLRAKLASKDLEGARDLLIQLRRHADEIDDTGARCDLAAVAAELSLAEGDAGTSLSLADEFLETASVCGLGLLRNELLEVRSRALMALGRAEEARAAAGEVKTFSVPLPLIEEPKRDWRPAATVEPPRATGPERRVQLHQAALAVIEDYNQRGLPFALYLRKYDFTVAHGPMEFGPRLTENVLHEAMPPGVRVLTIQSQDRSDGEYTGRGSITDRSAPALLLDHEHWQEVAEALIPFADLIVAECFLLGEGLRFELETAYRTERWDRTVLLLPPLKSYLEVIDSDPIIQMFPRCLWMDSLHTESLVDSPVARDLIARMATIAALPDEARRRLIDREARDGAYPIDLMPIAEHYETIASGNSQWQDQDDRIRYYGFWELFRASSIRGALLLDGDDSFENRLGLSNAYIQMSAILLDHEREDDKIVLVGDLTFAEQCAHSALVLMSESDDNPFGMYYRDRAAEQLRSVLALRRAVEQHPKRFLLRPRYGPFPVRAASSTEIGKKT